MIALGTGAAAGQLAVSRSLSAVNPPASVAMIDRRTMAVVEERPIPAPHPHALGTADGRFFTASLRQNLLATLRPDGSSATATLAGADQNFSQLAVAPAHERLAVSADLTGLVHFYAIGTDGTLAPEGTVSTGGRPWHSHFSLDGKTLYVPLYGANAVAVIDVATRAVVQTITGNGLANPYTAMLSPDGTTLFVSNSNLNGAYTASANGTVVWIDTATHAITRVVEVGRNPTGLAILGVAPLICSICPRAGVGRGLGAVLAVALLAGVAPVARAQPAFVREVEPFAVLDTFGTRVGQPFLGGFARPRPHLVDLDGDLDLDLVVQETTGRATRFENVGGGAFAWRTDRFLQGFGGFEWLRFVRFDNDPWPDLLLEQPLGYVQALRGTPEGTFERLADTVRLATGRPAFVDRQNVPALGDLTGDGRLDLLYAAVDGSLVFFEGTAAAPSGAPRFLEPVEAYQGIQIVGTFAKTADPRHGASALSLVDLDGDGDLDLLWGDFFSPSFYLVRNDGTPTAPRLVRAADTFPASTPFVSSGFNASAFGDVTGDGRADLVVGVVGGAFGRNRTPEPPLVRFEGRPPTPGVPFAFASPDPLLSTLDLGTSAAPAAADFDDDRDPDLIAGTGDGRLRAFVNTGDARRPVWQPGPLVVPDDPTRFDAAPAAGDLDGDGRTDLVVGAFDGTARWLRRTGAFRFEDAGVVAAPPRAQRLRVALGDLDGDGDLDLVAGDAGGRTFVYRNDGSRTAPAFVLVTETLVPRTLARLAPALADFDADGRADLALANEATGTVRFFAFSTPDRVAALPDTLVALPGPVPGLLRCRRRRRPGPARGGRGRRVRVLPQQRRPPGPARRGVRRARRSPPRLPHRDGRTDRGRGRDGRGRGVRRAGPPHRWPRRGDVRDGQRIALVRRVGVAGRRVRGAGHLAGPDRRHGSPCCGALSVARALCPDEALWPPPDGSALRGTFG